MNKKEFEETAIVKGMKIVCQNQNGIMRALCEELCPDEVANIGTVEYEIASICYPDRCFMIENHGGVYFPNCEFVKDDAYYKFNGDPWPRQLSSHYQSLKSLRKTAVGVKSSDGSNWEEPAEGVKVIEFPDGQKFDFPEGSKLLTFLPDPPPKRTIRDGLSDRGNLIAGAGIALMLFVALILMITFGIKNNNPQMIASGILIAGVGGAISAGLTKRSRNE